MENARHSINEQSEFWSKVAQKYDRVVDMSLGGKTRSIVRERLAKEGPLGRAVEIGCGTGFFTAALAAKATTLVATDLSPGMLAVARDRANAGNVSFQPEDCQSTSFPDGSFDTAFMSLVIHFTEPRQALVEMRRILKTGGTLIVANLDPGALSSFDRLRFFARMLYQGVVGYRTRPPKRFGRNMLTELQLCDLLRASGFEVVGTETIRDDSRSSNIPVKYVTARRL